MQGEAKKKLKPGGSAKKGGRFYGRFTDIPKNDWAIRDKPRPEKWVEQENKKKHKGEGGMKLVENKGEQRTKVIIRRDKKRKCGKKTQTTKKKSPQKKRRERDRDYRAFRKGSDRGKRKKLVGPVTGGGNRAKRRRKFIPGGRKIGGKKLRKGGKDGGKQIL